MRQTTALYRLYAEDGTLLYVGISHSWLERAFQHEHDKEWWPLVARVELDHFESRTMALMVERLAIKRFQPPFNRAHNPTPSEIAPQAPRLIYRDAELAWGDDWFEILYEGGNKTPLSEAIPLCVNCDLRKVTHGERCEGCYRYLRRTGKERPERWYRRNAA